jgi:hypothetical protein
MSMVGLFALGCYEMPLTCDGPCVATADTGPGYDVPCAIDGPAYLDVAHALDGWGLDETEIGCGIPPQGGAPYARFRLRIGDLDLSDGGTVQLRLTDRDSGEQLGGAELPMGFVCANVGDDADHWVGSEVHARFDGFTVEELLGRRVAVEATVVSDTESVTTSGTGTLAPF